MSRRRLTRLAMVPAGSEQTRRERHEPSADAGTLNKQEPVPFDGRAGTSDQDEIDQRDNRGASGGHDQRIVGADVRT